MKLNPELNQARKNWSCLDYFNQNDLDSSKADNSLEGIADHHSGNYKQVITGSTNVSKKQYQERFGGEGEDKYNPTQDIAQPHLTDNETTITTKEMLYRGFPNGQADYSLPGTKHPRCVFNPSQGQSGLLETEETSTVEHFPVISLSHNLESVENWHLVEEDPYSCAPFMAPNGCIPLGCDGHFGYICRRNLQDPGVNIPEEGLKNETRSKLPNAENFEGVEEGVRNNEINYKWLREDQFETRDTTETLLVRKDSSLATDNELNKNNSETNLSEKSVSFCMPERCAFIAEDKVNASEKPLVKGLSSNLTLVHLVKDIVYENFSHPGKVESKAQFSKVPQQGKNEEYFDKKQPQNQERPRGTIANKRRKRSAKVTKTTPSLQTLRAKDNRQLSKHQGKEKELRCKKRCRRDNPTPASQGMEKKDENVITFVDEENFNRLPNNDTCSAVILSAKKQTTLAVER